MSESLAEAYAREQARLDSVIETYKSMRGMPQVNVEPAIILLQDLRLRSYDAAMSGDPIKMLRLYEEMKGAK